MAQVYFYPKVLVIGASPFSESTGAGLTLRGLFKDWPADALSCLFIGESPIESGIACNTFSFSASSLRLMGLKLPGYAESQERKVTSSHAPVLSPYIFRKVKSYIHRQISMILDTGYYYLNDDFWAWVSVVKPDVIYSMMGSGRLVQLVRTVAERLNVPVIPHFMDDWVGVLYKDSLLYPILYKKMMFDLKAVFSKSPFGLTIGDEMAKEFRYRYHLDFYHFMNTLEDDWFQWKDSHCSTPNSPIQMIYVGGLHLFRWQSLADISLALSEINKKQVVAECVFYSQTRFVNEIERLKLLPFLKFGGSVKPDAVKELLMNADVVLHIESFNGKSMEYARYSISTKIPECMASGKPILGYGPKELASMQYISDVGLTVGSRDLSLLVEAIRCLCIDDALRYTLGQRGSTIARQSHSAVLERERFRSLLAQSVSG